MTKIQSDFYADWKEDLITVTKNSNGILGFTEEIINTDSSLGSFILEMPDITNMKTGKSIWFYDNGFASTNPITIKSGVGNTIQGGDYIISVDNEVVKFELIDNIWVVTNGLVDKSKIAGFYFNNNLTSTIILASNTYTDINGLAAPYAENSNFTFAASPNILTSGSPESYTALIDCHVALKRVSGGAARNIGIGLFSDTGTGYTLITGAESSGITSRNSNSLSVSTITTINDTDSFKVMLENRQSTDDILVTDIMFNVREVA